MLDVIRSFLVEPTPVWVSGAGILALIVLYARQASLSRRLSRHARSIANMDAWADVTDERLERVDWIKHRQRPANDSRANDTRTTPRGRWRMTG